MSNLDHVVPATTNQDPPRSSDKARGETITIYDFYGRVIDTVGITAHGDFQTRHGTMSPDDFGAYVLKVTGHPSAR